MFKQIAAFFQGFNAAQAKRQPMTVKMSNRDMTAIAHSYNQNQAINSVADLNQVARQAYIQRLALGTDSQKAIASAYAKTLGKRSYVNLSLAELQDLVVNNPNLWNLF